MPRGIESVSEKWVARATRPPRSAPRRPEVWGAAGVEAGFGASQSFRSASRRNLESPLGLISILTQGRASPSRRAARRAWHTSGSARWGQARPTVRWMGRAIRPTSHMKHTEMKRIARCSSAHSEDEDIRCFNTFSFCAFSVVRGPNS